MQLISDLTMMTIDRPVFIESAAHGAAMMAGLSFGTILNFSTIFINNETNMLYILRDMEIAK